MKKFELLIIASLTAALALTTFYLVSPSRMDLIESSTGCCTMLIDHSKQSISFTSVELTEVNYFDTEEELEDIKEYFAEFCFDNH